MADFPSLKMKHSCFIVPNTCCVFFKCLKKTRTHCRKWVLEMRKITIRSGHVRKGPPSFLGTTLASEWSIYAAPPPSFSMLNVVRRSVMRVKKSTKTDFNTKFRERTQHWKEGGGCVLWFKMFVITKDIEHKNVKRQVLEPLPANVPPKKSQPIRRQVRFDCL